MHLRPYQQDIIEATRTHLRAGTKSILIESPTGSGKTVLTAFMLSNAAKKNNVAWFVVHRRELIEQSSATFQRVGLPHGIVGAGYMQDRRLRVQICGVQTLVNRLDQLPAPGLIVWDECPHCSAGMWNRVYQAHPTATHIGLSATPERLDGTGLRHWFSVMVEGPSVRWLMDNGYLSDYRLFAPAKPNLDAVHTRMGEFVTTELDAAMDVPSITGDAIGHYRKLADGKPAVVFACSVKHSQRIVEQFRHAGYVAAHIDGTTHADERRYAMAEFRAGRIQVLSNVQLFGEGLDVPGIEVLIDLNPTQSLGWCMQKWGRALRPAEGKTHAIILDHAGNSARHGLPDDDREWSLDGRVKRRKADDAPVPVKQCPRCYVSLRAHVMTCKACGFLFEVNGREIEQREGELAEVDKEAIKRAARREQGEAKSYEELVALGRRRGVRWPEKWANYIMEGRKAKALREQLTRREYGQV